jgi:hypothetical protein
MLSIVILSKGENYPWNDKTEHNTNESLHCTNQGLEDRIPRNDKTKYNTDGSLHCTNQWSEDRITNGEPILYQHGARGPHPEKWQSEIWYKWESTLYQPGAREPHPEKWQKRNMIQMGAYTVLTRGQRIASRETTKHNRIQTQIWPPTLNTERHSILIAQIWIKNLNHIKNSKNIILIKRKTLWRGQWITDKQRCAVYIQTKRNETRWFGYTKQPQTEITRPASQHSHTFNAWLIT